MGIIQSVHNSIMQCFGTCCLTKSEKPRETDINTFNQTVLTKLMKIDRLHDE